MTPDLLHWYQCSFCKVTATTTVRRHETRISCNACFRWMAFLWSLPIVSDEQRALAARGLVYNPYGTDERAAYTKKPCDTCREHVERDTMIVLQGVGKFCSEDCAQVGVLKHQQVMERVEKLYQDEPGLRPTVKA